MAKTSKIGEVVCVAAPEADDFWLGKVTTGGDDITNNQRKNGDAGWIKAREVDSEGFYGQNGAKFIPNDEVMYIEYLQRRRKGNNTEFYHPNGLPNELWVDIFAVRKVDIKLFAAREPRSQRLLEDAKGKSLANEHATQFLWNDEREACVLACKTS